MMICGTGGWISSQESSGEFPCIICDTGKGSYSIFCNGCMHWVHKKCSGLERLTKDLDYRCTWCQGTARRLDGRPQREVQVRPDKLEVVVSFCYQGDMLSAAGGCELSATTHVKKCLEEVQGAATSSLFPPPLFQDTWPRVQLLCVERNAPCQWDLAIDIAKPPTSASEWRDNDQTDLQCQTARHCHHKVQWTTCVAWHWEFGPHPEEEKAPLVWRHGTLQRCSQDSLWHTGWWKAWTLEAQVDMEAADREGSERV